MPSSEKTYYLGLNKWHGGDKPKKDDFNDDNSRVDGAFGRLDSAVHTLEDSTESMLSAVEQAGQAVQALESHAQNSAIHVTQEEKSLWNSLTGMQPGDSMVIGTYTGNGNSSQKITTAGKPKFGLLFAADSGSVEINAGAGTSECRFGFFSASGSSLNISLQADGFTVNHTMGTPLNGHKYAFNTDGQSYVYVYWPE